MNRRAETCLSKAWFPYLVIGLITLSVWGQTVQFDFVWDDHLFITKNTSIRSLKNIPEMFCSLSAQASQSAPLFRPLRTAHFAILCALGGKALPQPWVFHTANVVWHALAAMLLFAVALLLFQRDSENAPVRARVWALVISIAFALHPVTSEVVCWAKCLDDIMAAVFVLAATRSLLHWREGQGLCWAAFLYFVLGVYSKESAAPFALLVLSIGRGFHGLRWRRSMALAAPFLFIAVVYLAHRHLVMGRSGQGAPISGTHGQTLIDMFPVVTKYARLLWGVPPFCIDYSYMEGHYPFISTEVLVGAAILILFLGAAIWALRRHRFWTVGFGLLWIGLFLAPVSNLVPMMQYMAERFLYLPLLGFLLALGALLLGASRSALASRSEPALHPYLLNALAGITVLIWACLSWNRLGIWRDRLTLFVRSSLELPRSRRVEKNALAAILSEPHMRALLPADVEPDSLEIANAISPQEAEPIIRSLTQAQRIFPDNDMVSTILGFAYARSGQLAEAIPRFESAARQNPQNPQCWINLAAVRMDNREEGSKARAACETALRLAPTNVEALGLELKLCSDQGDYRAALSCAKKLQELEPGNQNHQKRIDEIEKKIDAANRKITPP